MPASGSRVLDWIFLAWSNSGGGLMPSFAGSPKVDR
jgi:hypothetical protein